MKHYFKLLTLVLVSSLPYLNSVFSPLIFDDVFAILKNPDVIDSKAPLSQIFLHDFWGTSLTHETSHKSYRPLTVLTFKLNYLLHGTSSFGYHILNLTLHVLVVLLYDKTLRDLFLSFFSCSSSSLRSSPWSSSSPSRSSHTCKFKENGDSIAFMSSLLFSIHPIHCEAVAGVVGRAELLSSIFFLSSLLLYIRKKYLAFCLFVILSLLSKEQGLSVLGLCTLLEILEFSKGNHILALKRLFSLLSLFFFLLTLRILVMGSSLPVFTPFDNPASFASTPIKIYTNSYIASLNFFLLLCPSSLLCDWSMNTVPLLESPLDPRNLSTLSLLLLLLILFFAATSRKPLLLSLFLLICPFLPSSNLFFPVGFVIAERVLYLPSMGFCLLIALGLWTLGSFKKSLSFVSFSLSLLLFSLLLLLFALKTYLRNYDWSSELRLFTSGLKISENNGKLWNNVGHALESTSPNLALIYYQKASFVSPNDIGAYINIGRSLVSLNQTIEAEKAYRKALSLLPRHKRNEAYTARIDPYHLSVFLNLGTLIAKDPERLEEANTLYRQAISMRSDFLGAYINLGDVLLQLNRSREALEVYKAGLAIETTNADLHYNIGVVQLRMKNVSEALRYFNKTLKLNSTHGQALLHSGILLQESEDVSLRPLAKERLYSSLSFFPSHEGLFFHLGMIAMDEKNYEEASTWFEKAIDVKPDFSAALFNFALLLSQSVNKSDLALPLLQTLVHYHPSHVKGLLLLGEIYTNVVKDYEEAQKTYLDILNIDDSHVQSRHNLCVLLVEKNLWVKAEKCFKDVLLRAPHEKYIQKHLQIVQRKLQKIKH